MFKSYMKLSNVENLDTSDLLADLLGPRRTLRDKVPRPASRPRWVVFLVLIIGLVFSSCTTSFAT